VQIASEQQTRKAERRRRLKKHVDSTDDNDSPVIKPAVKHNAPIFASGSDEEDNVPVSVASVEKDSSKVAVKRNAPSIFDSGSEEEDDMPIPAALGKKDSANVAEETHPQNVQNNDETNKKSSDDKKRKRSATSEDPASQMYISWFLIMRVSMYYCYLLSTDNITSDDQGCSRC
jgi:FK506-binding nuclear protein